MIELPDAVKEIEMLQVKWGSYSTWVADLEKLKELVLWEREQNRRDRIVERADYPIK